MTDRLGVGGEGIRAREEGRLSECSDWTVRVGECATGLGAQPHSLLGRMGVKSSHCFRDSQGLLDLPTKF